MILLGQERQTLKVMIIYVFFGVWLVYQGADRGRCEREAKIWFNDYCVHFNIALNAFVGVILLY